MRRDRLRRFGAAAVVAAALFAAVGCHRRGIDRREAAVSGVDVREVSALLAAADARSLDLPMLERALASPTAALRRAAVLAVGQSNARGRG